MNSSPLSKLIRNLFWIVPLAIVIGLWEYTSPILFQLVLAYIGLIVLNPMVNWLESFTQRRGLSVGLVIFFGFFIFIMIINTVWPILEKQGSEMQSMLTMDTFNNLRSRTETIAGDILPETLFIKFHSFLNTMDTAMGDIWRIAVTDLKSMASKAGNVILALGSLLMSTIFILVFLIFLLLDAQNFKRAFIRAVPNRYFEMTLRILDKIGDSINAYIRGQLLAAISVGITSIIGLYSLQWLTGIYIPYTYIIGCVAGLSNLIPFIGPIMGMISAVVVYLVSDQTIPIQFVYVLSIMIVFGIVQLIDNIIVSPLIMSGSVGLHPLFVIIFVMVGGAIAGPLGMLFAVPIAAILKVVITELVWGFKNYGYL
jgi:predicted PurR-regulated permease PerM